MFYCSCGQALSSHSVALFGRRCIPCYLKHREALKVATTNALLAIYKRRILG